MTTEERIEAMFQREIRYERTDGQIADTTYSDDGEATTIWTPTVDNPADA